MALLTAGYFGGMGSQNCTLWVDGRSESGLQINEVLARFGIEARQPHDAFDTVGLGQYRRTETWAAHAVIDPIWDSVEALIGALAYNCSGPVVREAVRSLAAYRLGELKAVQALDALKHILQKSQGGERSSAATALGEMGEPALPILIDALNAGDELNMRVSILLALKKMGPAATSAVPYLVPLIQDDYLMMRNLAIETLGAIGPGAQSAVPYLIPLLRHEDWTTRLRAIETLEAIGSVGAEVEALLADPEQWVRDAAGKALSPVREGKG